MHRLTATDTPMVRYTRTIFPSYAERAIEISKFDYNTIEALVHSQLLVQVDGRVYLDKPLYDYRYKEKYIYYGEIILLIILLIFVFYAHYLETTLFWRQ